MTAGIADGQTLLYWSNCSKWLQLLVDLAEQDQLEFK